MIGSGNSKSKCEEEEKVLVCSGDQRDWSIGGGDFYLLRVPLVSLL